MPGGGCFTPRGGGRGFCFRVRVVGARLAGVGRGCLVPGRVVGASLRGRVVGASLTEGVLAVRNVLVGAVRASCKIAIGADLVKRLVQGAGYGNAARVMMLAVGCIRAQRCHPNTRLTGVTPARSGSSWP